MTDTLYIPLNKSILKIEIIFFRWMSCWQKRQWHVFDAAKWLKNPITEKLKWCGNFRVHRMAKRLPIICSKGYEKTSYCSNLSVLLTYSISNILRQCKLIVHLRVPRFANNFIDFTTIFGLILLIGFCFRFIFLQTLIN